MTKEINKTLLQTRNFFYVGEPYFGPNGKVFPILKKSRTIYSCDLVRGLGVDWPFKLKERQVHYSYFGERKTIYHPSNTGKRVAILRHDGAPVVYDLLQCADREQADNRAQKLNNDQPDWLINSFVALDHEQLLEDLYE